MKHKITSQIIKKLSYTDFVGLINQWNVPPGAHATINKWIQYARIDNKSKILDIACTTGFSSREISLVTKCSGVGIDISKSSINRAKQNLKSSNQKLGINYINIDSYKYLSNKKFTHIVFGASLRFFNNPEKMLEKSLLMLKNEGYILASEFFITKPIPQSLVKKAKNIFGINITRVGYKDVMKIYEGLEILYEDKNDLVPETDQELIYYCESTTDRAMKILKTDDNKIYKTIFDRLYSIKKMSNILRPYQKYNVLVLRYRKNIYPNRYVELF